MELVESRKQVPDLIFLPSVDSTNLELERRLQTGAPDYTVLVAAEQTAGLGRLGRSWVSQPGASLSLSVLLGPMAPEVASLSTLLAATAVHRALSGNYPNAKFEIKWPNDILVGGKKVCGILATLKSERVILGIGVNLQTQAGTPDTATSLSELGPTSFDVTLAAILRELNQLLFTSEPAARSAMEYLRANCITLDSQVRAQLPDGSEILGLATAITDLGLLVIEGNETVELAAGDVWHLRN